MKPKTETPEGVAQPPLVRLGSDHGYSVSRDYEKLYEMAHRRSVLCFVDYHNCRDISATLVRGDEIELSARGIGYVWATSKADFVEACRRLNVEFIFPPNT